MGEVEFTPGEHIVLSEGITAEVIGMHRGLVVVSVGGAVGHHPPEQVYRAPSPTVPMDPDTPGVNRQEEEA